MEKSSQSPVKKSRSNLMMKKKAQLAHLNKLRRAKQFLSQSQNNTPKNQALSLSVRTDDSLLEPCDAEATSIHHLLETISKKRASPVLLPEEMPELSSPSNECPPLCLLKEAEKETYEPDTESKSQEDGDSQPLAGPFTEAIYFDERKAELPQESEHGEVATRPLADEALELANGFIPECEDNTALEQAEERKEELVESVSETATPANSEVQDEVRMPEVLEMPSHVPEQVVTEVVEELPELSQESECGEATPLADEALEPAHGFIPEGEDDTTLEQAEESKEGLVESASVTTLPANSEVTDEVLISEIPGMPSHIPEPVVEVVVEELAELPQEYGRREVATPLLADNGLELVRGLIPEGEDDTALEQAEEMKQELVESVSETTIPVNSEGKDEVLRPEVLEMPLHVPEPVVQETEELEVLPTMTKKPLAKKAIPKKPAKQALRSRGPRKPAPTHQKTPKTQPPSLKTVLLAGSAIVLTSSLGYMLYSRYRKSLP